MKKELLPDVKTLQIKDLAKLHKMSIKDLKTQLEMGKKVEKEHTKSSKLASEIARDHLKELPNYYTKLKKVEEDFPVNNASGGDVEGLGENPPVSKHHSPRLFKMLRRRLSAQSTKMGKKNDGTKRR